MYSGAMQTKATNLNPWQFLADGTLVTRILVTQRYVRLSGIKAGRRVCRSYRHDQMVETER